MHKGRMEAFSDGVIAIIITIMVLEIKVPYEATLEALMKLAPVFISYVISFMYVGIYWNNHHHLLQSVHKIDGRVLLANLGLLVWLSLIPFATGWMGENHFQPLTVTLYGIILQGAAFSYYVLTVYLLKIHDNTAAIHKAVGNKLKERISLVSYLTGLILSFSLPEVSIGIYTLVAIMWLYPDKRIERQLAK